MLKSSRAVLVNKGNVTLEFEYSMRQALRLHWIGSLERGKFATNIVINKVAVNPIVVIFLILLQLFAVLT